MFRFLIVPGMSATQPLSAFSVSPALESAASMAATESAADPTAELKQPASRWLIVGVVAALVALFAPTFARLLAIWSEDPDYSHGFVVIPASLYFAYVAWQRAQEQGKPLELAADARWQGGLSILLGVVLHWAALLFDVLIVDVLALIVVLRGVLKLVAGRRINEVFAFPALFLLFMAPLPPPVHQAVAIFMQQTVAAASTLVLDLSGVPVHREGYLIHLPRGYLMEVGEACSGLRSMIAIIALAVALGFMTNGPKWYRWTLGLMALPIAGLANCIRIVLTGVILMNLGREYAEGLFHQLEGAVLIALAALMLMGLSYCLLQCSAPAAKPEAAK